MKGILLISSLLSELQIKSLLNMNMDGKVKSIKDHWLSPKNIIRVSRGFYFTKKQIDNSTHMYP